jgi:hypothetical protein
MCMGTPKSAGVAPPPTPPPPPPPPPAPTAQGLTVGANRGLPTIKGQLDKILGAKKKSPRLNIPLGGIDPNVGNGVNIPGYTQG